MTTYSPRLKKLGLILGLLVILRLIAALCLSTRPADVDFKSLDQQIEESRQESREREKRQLRDREQLLQFVQGLSGADQVVVHTSYPADKKGPFEIELRGDDVAQLLKLLKQKLAKRLEVHSPDLHSSHDCYELRFVSQKEVVLNVILRGDCNYCDIAGGAATSGPIDCDDAANLLLSFLTEKLPLAAEKQLEIACYHANRSLCAGRFDEAESILNAHRDQGQTDIFWHFVSGNLHQARRDWQRAIDSYSHVVKLDGSPWQAGTALALTQMMAGQSDSAINVLQSSDQQFSPTRHLDVRLDGLWECCIDESWLAVAYVLAGNHAGALSQFRETDTRVGYRCSGPYYVWRLRRAAHVCDLRAESSTNRYRSAMDKEIVSMAAGQLETYLRKRFPREYSSQDGELTFEFLVADTPQPRLGVELAIRDSKETVLWKKTFSTSPYSYHWTIVWDNDHTFYYADAEAVKWVRTAPNVWTEVKVFDDSELPASVLSYLGRGK